jgi:two-component system, chemotaxis family, protein-glutamate methylesterase/glutaminase
MVRIVVIAASAGGHKPLQCIIAALPMPCLAAVFVVMHVGSHPSNLPSLLSNRGPHPAIFAQEGALIEPGHIYVAPPDRHMVLGHARIRLNQGPKVHFTRPAADPFFISAAKIHGSRVMGIVLSGNGSDGAAGLRAIVEHGGTALVQDPREAAVASMPLAAIMADPDARLPVDMSGHFVPRGGPFSGDPEIYRTRVPTAEASGRLPRSFRIVNQAKC